METCKCAEKRPLHQCPFDYEEGFYGNAYCHRRRDPALLRWLNAIVALSLRFCKDDTSAAPRDDVPATRVGSSVCLSD